MSHEPKIFIPSDCFERLVKAVEFRNLKSVQKQLETADSKQLKMFIKQFLKYAQVMKQLDEAKASLGQIKKQDHKLVRTNTQGRGKPQSIVLRVSRFQRLVKAVQQRRIDLIENQEEDVRYLDTKRLINEFAKYAKAIKQLDKVRIRIQQIEKSSTSQRREDTQGSVSKLLYSEKFNTKQSHERIQDIQQQVVQCPQQLNRAYKRICKEIQSGTSSGKIQKVMNAPSIPKAVRLNLEMVVERLMRVQKYEKQVNKAGQYEVDYQRSQNQKIQSQQCLEEQIGKRKHLTEFICSIEEALFQKQQNRQSHPKFDPTIPRTRERLIKQIQQLKMEQNCYSLIESQEPRIFIQSIGHLDSKRKKRVQKMRTYFQKGSVGEIVVKWLKQFNKVAFQSQDNPLIQKNQDTDSFISHSSNSPIGRESVGKERIFTQLFQTTNLLEILNLKDLRVALEDQCNSIQRLVNSINLSILSLRCFLKELNLENPIYQKAQTCEGLSAQIQKITTQSLGVATQRFRDIQEDLAKTKIELQKRIKETYEFKQLQQNFKSMSSANRELKSQTDKYCLQIQKLQEQLQQIKKSKKDEKLESQINNATIKKEILAVKKQKIVEGPKIQELTEQLEGKDQRLKELTEQLQELQKTQGIPMTKPNQRSQHQTFGSTIIESQAIASSLIHSISCCLSKLRLPNLHSPNPPKESLPYLKGFTLLLKYEKSKKIPKKQIQLFANNLHLLFIFKAKNNKTVGAFSTNCWTAAESAEGNQTQGMIFSYDNSEPKERQKVDVYYSLEGKRSIDLNNEFYLRFGNSELRFDWSANQISSQIGMSEKNRSFKTGELTSEQFLGVKKQGIVGVEDYQVYALQFSGDAKKQQEKKEQMKEHMIVGKEKSKPNYSEKAAKIQTIGKPVHENLSKSSNQPQNGKTERLISDKVNHKFEEQNRTLQQQLKRLHNDMEQLTELNSTLQNNLTLETTSKHQVMTMKAEVDGLNERLKKQIGDLESQISMLREDITEKSQNISNMGLQSEKVNLQKDLDIQDLTNKLQQTREEYHCTETYLLAEKERTALLQGELRQLKVVSQSDKTFIQALEQRISAIESTAGKLSDQLEHKKTELNRAQQDYDIALHKLSKVNEYETEITKLSLLFKERNQQSPSYHLQGEVLLSQSTEGLKLKKYVIMTLQSIFGKAIMKTRLLYRYDPMNKVNFHHYIDGHPNFLLIAKTMTERYVGAFSEQALKEDRVSTQRGMLFSLVPQNPQYFPLNPNNKSSKTLIYDGYYLIFGNSQLRIKTQDNKIFSNFAIVNNFFETRKNTVNVLFGQGDHTREVLLENYQIFEVIFIQSLSEK